MATQSPRSTTLFAVEGSTLIVRAYDAAGVEHVMEDHDGGWYVTYPVEGVTTGKVFDGEVEVFAGNQLHHFDPKVMRGA